MEEDQDQWWHPVPVDDALIARLRADYPEDTKGLDDEDVLHKFEYDGPQKYATTWDHTGDAYEQFEKLADDWFRLRAEINEQYKVMIMLKRVADMACFFDVVGWDMKEYEGPCRCATCSVRAALAAKEAEGG